MANIAHKFVSLLFIIYLFIIYKSESFEQTDFYNRTDRSATCTTSGTRCDNYSKQDNCLWIDDVMKYCVVIYQFLVKISNGLNDKSGKKSLARNVLTDVWADDDRRYEVAPCSDRFKNQNKFR